MTPALWPVTGTIEPPTVRAEVSNEDIERWVGNQPRDVVRKLPDCPERADALGHIDAAERLAHAAREKHRPE